MAIVKSGRQQFAAVFQEVIVDRSTVNPANLADGAGEIISVTVAGAAIGDLVLVAPGVNLAGITVTGYVSAANTVSVRIQNESGGAVDLASSTWTFYILKRAD